MKQFLYWVTQENSIEFLVQSSLPYILLLMVRANYCAPYPKWPCVWHEASMCCPCCITSLYSRTFYFILLNPVISLVTTLSLMWQRDWLILTQFVLKIENEQKGKKKDKIKWKVKNKIKSTIDDLDKKSLDDNVREYVHHIATTCRTYGH